MKLIAVDNFARETAADRLVAENISEFWGPFLAESANRNTANGSDIYFRAVPDDYRLSRGMEDLV